MHAVTFDTLKFATHILVCDPSGQHIAVKHRSRRCFVETLEQAKLPREQASAIAAAVRDTHISIDVATKTDLDALETRTDSKFELLRKEMDAKFELLRKDMETMRKDIIIKQGAMMVTLAGLVFAGVKLF